MLWAPNFVKRRPAIWAVILFVLVVLPGAVDAWLSLWESWRQGPGREAPVIPFEVPDWLSLASSIIGLLLMIYILLVQRSTAREVVAANMSGAQVKLNAQRAAQDENIRGSASRIAAKTESATGAKEKAANLTEEARNRSVENFRKFLPHFSTDQKNIILALLNRPTPFRKYSPGVNPLESKGYIRAEHVYNEKDQTYIYVLVAGYKEAAIDWRDAGNRVKVQQIAAKIGDVHKMALSFFTLPEGSELPWPEPRSQEMKSLYYAFVNLSREGLLHHLAPHIRNMESFSLGSEFWPLVSEHILAGKKIARGSVTISRSKIPGPGGSGAGAPASSDK